MKIVLIDGVCAQSPLACLRQGNRARLHSEWDLFVMQFGRGWAKIAWGAGASWTRRGARRRGIVRARRRAAGDAGRRRIIAAAEEAHIARG